MDRLELERYVYSLEEEMKRRDRWLINAIWNVQQALSTVGYTLLIFGTLAFVDDIQWWHGLAGAAAWLVASTLDSMRRDKLEKDDLDRIGRDSVIDAPIEKVRE